MLTVFLVNIFQASTVSQMVKGSVSLTEYRIPNTEYFILIVQKYPDSITGIHPQPQTLPQYSPEAHREGYYELY
jgi:hypothetical protein